MSLAFRQKTKLHGVEQPNRLIHRFYEALVLLKVLDPTRGEPNDESTSDITPDINVWRQFLDQLSWICDYETGGDTVSAIAVERNPSGPIFWLAANKNPSVKALPYLKWVLKRLEESFDCSEVERGKLKDEIFTKCIELSKAKVKNYSRILCGLISRTTDSLSRSEHPSDVEILKKLRELESLRENHRELCLLAYKFIRQSILMDLLWEKGNTTAESHAWHNMRHHIGRLGSWSKASVILARFATNKKFAHMIQSFKVRCVESGPRVAGPSLRSKTTIESALGRMFSDNEILQEMRDNIASFPLATDIEGVFRQAYADLEPRVHAELLLLEHFFHGKLDFLNNDRYIGCSKPSCYCCDLYMKFHPGTIVTRACHGNLWANWQAPIPPIRNEEQSRKHTAALLNAMAKRIRQDVLEQIRSKNPRRQRVPDSTTGTSIEILASVSATTAAAAVETATSNPYDHPRFHEGIPGTVFPGDRRAAPPPLRHLSVVQYPRISPSLSTASADTIITRVAPTVIIRRRSDDEESRSKPDADEEDDWSDRLAAISLGGDAGVRQGEEVEEEGLGSDSEDGTLVFRGRGKMK